MATPLTVYAAGPGDPTLRSNALEGYRPIRGPGEVVLNSFVDANQYKEVRTLVSSAGYELAATTRDGTRGNVIASEVIPPFHEWASATEGMVCIEKKARDAVYSKYVSAQMAVPVVVCASGLGHDQLDNYRFAGIARSRSIRHANDGIGPMVDEMFTVAIGGLVTVLNNSSTYICVGDEVEWFFIEDGVNNRKRSQSDCRHIGTKKYKIGSPRSRIYGVAKRSANPGHSFDVLLRV